MSILANTTSYGDAGEKVLVDQVEVRLKQIIFEVSQELEVEILEIKTDKDHIHILAEIDPSLAVCKFIRTAKGRSSRLSRVCALKN